MKHFLLVVVVLACLSARAQQDFDYTLYTSHLITNKVMKNDSVYNELRGERQIIKVNNVLKIVYLQNTGSTVEYKIAYQGVSWGQDPANKGYYKVQADQMFFYYTSGDVYSDSYYIIKVNPVTPLVIITKKGDGKFLSEYY